MKSSTKPNISLEKSSTEEATSSVELETESSSAKNLRETSDSFVSTSETSLDPPTSKAQVLEELKARIRELEGSPHYKCFICKVRVKFYI